MTVQWMTFVSLCLLFSISENEWLKKMSISDLENDYLGCAYRGILEGEQNQIIDDLHDLGKEGHYFDEYAFAYLGLLDEYDKA